MEFTEAVRTRRSIRSYTDQPVPEDALASVLAAGQLAAIGMKDYKGIHIVVIRNREVIDAIAAEASESIGWRKENIFYNAPIVIIVCARSDSRTPLLSCMDAGCIIQNMMLAATDSGLGSVYVYCAVPPLAANRTLCARAGIPEDFEPISCMPLGFIKEAAAPRESDTPLAVTVVE